MAARNAASVRQHVVNIETGPAEAGNSQAVAVETPEAGHMFNRSLERLHHVRRFRRRLISRGCREPAVPGSLVPPELARRRRS